MTPTTQRLTVELERTLDAPVDAVFAALTDPVQVVRWLGPSDDYTGVVHAWDLRVGGHLRVSLTRKDGTVHTVVGSFREIVPGRKLAYTWSWEGGETLDSVVTFLLSDVGGKTALALTHEGLPNEEARRGHEEGWRGSLERLARALA